MKIRKQAPTGSFASAPKASRTLVYDVPATEVPRHRVVASLARCNCDATVIGPIRRKLRAIASESGPGKGRHETSRLDGYVQRGGAAMGNATLASIILIALSTGGAFAAKVHRHSFVAAAHAQLQSQLLEIPNHRPHYHGGPKSNDTFDDR